MMRGHLKILGSAWKNGGGSRSNVAGNDTEGTTPALLLPPPPSPTSINTGFDWVSFQSFHVFVWFISCLRSWGMRSGVRLIFLRVENRQRPNGKPPTKRWAFLRPPLMSISFSVSPFSLHVSRCPRLSSMLCLSPRCGSTMASHPYNPWPSPCLSFLSPPPPSLPPFLLSFFIPSLYFFVGKPNHFLHCDRQYRYWYFLEFSIFLRVDYFSAAETGSHTLKMF